MSQTHRERNRPGAFPGDDTEPSDARHSPSDGPDRDAEPHVSQGDQGRSPAEWISLIISITVVFGLVTVIAYLYLTDEPLTPTFNVTPQVENVQEQNGLFYLPIVIENTGGETAEDVRVVATLTGPDGGEEEAEVTIDFLAGGAIENATVVFAEDPRSGELSANVSSFLNP